MSALQKYKIQQECFIFCVKVRYKLYMVYEQEAELTADIIVGNVL